MPISVDVRCTQCDGDRSALRLTVAETVWYLLDVTDEGIYPVQPEAERHGRRHDVWSKGKRQEAVPSAY